MEKDMAGAVGAVSTIWNTLRSWIGLILPVLKKPTDFRSWPQWFRVLLYLVVVPGAIAGLLWWVSSTQTLAERFLWIKGNWWLPVAGLCVYALCWLLYLLIQTMLEDDDVVEFPDIHEAWTQAVGQLAQANLRVTELPMFLILGRTAAGDEALFRAAGLKEARPVPGDPKAPVRFFANRDALYVVCSGASGWGRYCGCLAGEPLPFDGTASGAVPPGATLAPSDATKTIRPEDAAAASMGPDKALLDEMNQLVALSTQRALTPEEKARLQELSDLYRTKPAAKEREPIPRKVLTTDQARLNYLCRLIRRERRPWCPINGILVLIPWTSLENESTNREGYPVLGQELAQIRSTLDLRAPIIAMVCDLEGATGFREFRGCFQAETLAKQRIGQRVPLVPDAPASELPTLYESVAQWIGQNVLPRWVMQFLRVDQPNDLRRTPGVASSHNANLYFLLREMYLRSPRLGRTLGKAIPITEPGSKDVVPLFAGCYLAATGRSDAETAFAAGVFSRLVENQNFVSWTPRAYARQSRYGSMSLLFSVASLLLVVVAGLLIWNLIPHGISK